MLTDGTLECRHQQVSLTNPDLILERCVGPAMSACPWFTAVNHEISLCGGVGYCQGASSRRS